MMLKKKRNIWGEESSLKIKNNSRNKKCNRKKKSAIESLQDKLRKQERKV